MINWLWKFIITKSLVYSMQFIWAVRVSGGAQPPSPLPEFRRVETPIKVTIINRIIIK